MQHVLVLVGFHAHAPVVRIVPPAQPAVLGRNPDCDLVVGDASVSRRHAELLAQGDALVVADLGSRNGTFIEGTRVDRAKVTRGQQVRFGRVTLALGVHERGNLVNLNRDTADALEGDGPNMARPAGRSLTPALQRVFDLLAQGLTESAIAARLDRSPHTIHRQIAAIYRAFGVTSKAKLLAYLVRAGAGSSTRGDGSAYSEAV